MQEGPDLWPPRQENAQRRLLALRQALGRLELAAREHNEMNATRVQHGTRAARVLQRADLDAAQQLRLVLVWQQRVRVRQHLRGMRELLSCTHGEPGDMAAWARTSSRYASTSSAGT